MTTPIAELKGMNDDLTAKLKEKGVSNNEQYLELTAAPKDRKALASDLGVKTRDVLEIANRADLARVKGVSGIYSDLLEHAGVDTVKELAHRKPENLQAKMNEVNDEKNLTGRVPPVAEVEKWVAQAKDLPKILTY